MRYLGAGVFLAAIFICFPEICQSERPEFAAAMSLSHVIRMFVVDTGITDVTENLRADTLGGLYLPYKVLVCLLYLCAPIFTLTVVLQYFSNIFELFRLWFRKGDSLYVFSKLNSRSLEIAENIDGILIFCSSSDQDERNRELEEKARCLGAIFMQSQIEYLRIRKKCRNITYFQVSDDENENLEVTLKMIEKLSETKDRNITIYCFATDHEAEILLDAPDKGNLKVVLVDEVREAIYNHLYHYPLYLNKGIDREMDEKISVLIIGGGKTGSEFLKASAWCGQMNDYHLDIHLFDKDIKAVEKALKEESPELMEKQQSYQLNLIEGNALNDEMEKMLGSLKDISYCMIALGNDEDNIKVALGIRKYFYLREAKIQPFICTYIKNKEKRSVIWQLYENTRSKKKLYYNIIPFGGVDMCIGGQSSKATILEYLGLGIQFHYFRLMQDASEEDRKAAIQNFYSKQFNRRSSIASGMHISYKLWECGYGIIKIPKEKEKSELFHKYIHEKRFIDIDERIRKKFYNLEHERWVAFVRSEGWRLATRGGESLADIRKCYESYCAQFKNQNYLMKLHPALVPIYSEDPAVATLIQVEEMMTEVNREKGLGDFRPDYVQSDIELIDNIDQIISGSWCGENGIQINGVTIHEGRYMICDLQDMQKYYLALYKKQKEEISSERLLGLRAKIKQCAYGVLRHRDDKKTEEILSYILAEERGLDVTE